MVDSDEQAMLDGLFAAIDARDADAFVGFLSDDSSFRFGSAPAAEGKVAIRAAVAGFFETISGLAHRIDNVFGKGSTLFCEGEVRYTRHDGSTVALPFADVFEMHDGLIREYKIYMDIAPLYAS